MNLPRRQFLARSTGALCAPLGAVALANSSSTRADDAAPAQGDAKASPRSGSAPAPVARTGKPTKKLAVVTTIYRQNSHADHIAGRFLTGYTIGGRQHTPDYQVVSMFVEQVGSNDLSRGLSRHLGFRHCETIRDCLLLGGSELAVDAVLLIGEHGDYPVNKYGQTEYPRHRLMKSIVDVFRETGRAAPVFNDKHFSYEWNKAREMYEWSKELNFPLQAGSSLPLTWRLPELEFPLETEFEDALCVAFSDPERYGFHALETLFCHIERRRGGETGIKSVQTLRGDAVWKAGEEGRWSLELLDAALGRSHTLKPGDIRRHAYDPHAYLLQFRDGFHAAVLMLDGAVGDFTFAAKVKGDSAPKATLHYLPNPPAAKYFDALCYNIERMFAAGRAVIPVERTLLVSGVLQALMHSRFENSRRVTTPELSISYRAPEYSGFFRGAVDRTGQREQS